MNDLLSLTSAQLNHAADLKEKIVELETELASVLDSNSPAAPKRKPGRPRKKATFALASSVPKVKRRKMSASARAKIAAAAKARWANAKAAGNTSL